MISLMTYVSAERTGHATESRKITLPPRVSPSHAPFFHARITCYASNKCPFQRSSPGSSQCWCEIERGCRAAKYRCGNKCDHIKTNYSRIPITRTFKGNRKQFELSEFELSRVKL